MAQYDLILIQNTHVSGTEFTEKLVNIAKGGLLSAATGGVPTVLVAGTNGYMLVRDDAEVTGLKWIAVSAGHTQGTDAGTTGTVFELDSDGYKIELTAESAAKFGVKVDGGATYADFQAKDIICNDITVNGTTTTINSTTLTVDDKNIELGSVASPSDTTADGGGITLKGATDKTILWDNANDNWTLNQAVNLPTGLTYKINNTTVLSATQVLGVTLGTAAAANTTAFEAAGVTATHAALQTGVHGISITAGKTLTASNSLTLTATDGSTLAIGTGGTLGTAAYTATTAYATSTQGTTADNAIPKAILDAETILYATVDNTPAALAVGASTFVGRKASGSVSAMSVAEAKTLLAYGTMAAETATNYMLNSVADANSVLYAVTDNTPAALTMAASTMLGRKSTGNIVALTQAEIMPTIYVTAPVAYNSDGTVGQIAVDGNYAYRCTTTGSGGTGRWVRHAVATNW